jgi:beta-lactamase regulating signal transducer with metallopeptidase domain/Leucine-rich repeat (LRR) protein
MLTNTSFTDLAIPILADSAIKACVLLLIAALAVSALRNSSAASRHWAWVVALMAVLLVPILSLVLPQNRVLPTWLTTVQTVKHTQRDSLSDAEMEMMLDPFGEHGIGSSNAEPGLADSSAVDSASTLVTSQPNVFTLKSTVLTVWAIVSVVMLTRIVLSRLILSRIIRSAEPLPSGPLSEILGEVTKKLDVRGAVRVYITSRRSMPMAWGIFETCLALPDDAKHWQASRLRAVLLHELGHAKRRDMLTHVLVQLVSSIYWFHPLVWLAKWRVHIERERACDDLVVASGMQPSEYAGHLLAIVTGSRSGQVVPCAALAMAKSSLLEGRIMAILNERICRKPLTSGLFACSILVGIAGATAVATLQAKPLPLEQQTAPGAKEQSPANESAVTTPPEAADDALYDAEREAEEILSGFNARIERDEDGEVIWVAVWSQQFSDGDLEILNQLNWSNEQSNATRRRYVNSSGKAFPQPGLVLVGTGITESGIVKLTQITDKHQLAMIALDDTPITDANLKQLAGLKSLRSLYLNRTKVTDAGLRQNWKSLVRLEHLALDGTDVSDESLAELPKYAEHCQLKTLNVSNTKVTDKGLEHLKALKNLRSMYLDGTKINGSGLVHLKSPIIKSIHLKGSSVTDAGLESVKDMPAMRYVFLNDTNISDAGLAHLKDLKVIQAIDADGSKVTDVGLAHVRELTSLTVLRLSETAVTDRGLANLIGLINLESLELNDTEITGEGLTHIRGLTNLRSLYLGKTAVTDRGLANLISLNNLESLALNDTEITDEGLAHVRRLTSLRSLRLSETAVTDRGLANLIELDNLESLALNNTQISDEGLKHLKDLNSLRYVDLEGTDVTDEGVEKLKEAQPAYFIRYDGRVLRPSNAGG